ncbi:hypothetical protein Zmor_014828 [Zophobas morio]|uniref:Uncharacterized protein n=1 Tax=Zophobas morio TaxID=2755281 RepID=A0AA38ID58_9CUCU|nr:hypothetical protein Zmor_014828 [Zophobas morio]
MEIPEEIRKKALSVVQNLLPDTSKELYDREYQLFKQQTLFVKKCYWRILQTRRKDTSHLPYGPNTLG